MNRSIRNITIIVCAVAVLIAMGFLFRYMAYPELRLEGRTVTGIVTYADDDGCVIALQQLFLNDRVLLTGVPSAMRHKGTKIRCRLTDVGVATGPPMAPIYGKAEDVIKVQE